ncbi:MAG TPA: hypothetical protein VF710_08590 [Longimicrobium sp.]
MRARALAAAALVLAGCGKESGDFNGRVGGTIEGPLAGTSWYCESPGGVQLTMEDERRSSVITFIGAPGSLTPGAWLLGMQPQPGGFRVDAALDAYPDPDAERLAIHVRGGKLTIDAVRDGVVSGRYEAETVTTDVKPTTHPDGRVGRVPNAAGTLVGFFKAVRRECPSSGAAKQ